MGPARLSNLHRTFVCLQDLGQGFGSAFSLDREFNLDRELRLERCVDWFPGNAWSFGLNSCVRD